MKNNRRTRLSKNLNKILEDPRELTENSPKFTIIGFDEMLVENYTGILEYEEFYIKIKTGIGNINISGFNLSLEEVTGDDIAVKGKIESIDIERTIGEE